MCIFLSNTFKAKCRCGVEEDNQSFPTSSLKTRLSNFHPAPPSALQFCYQVPLTTDKSLISCYPHYQCCRRHSHFTWLCAPVNVHKFILRQNKNLLQRPDKSRRDKMPEMEVQFWGCGWGWCVHVCVWCVCVKREGVVGNIQHPGGNFSDRNKVFLLTFSPESDLSSATLVWEQTASWMNTQTSGRIFVQDVSCQWATLIETLGLLPLPLSLSLSPSLFLPLSFS